ncbi:type II secretion system protein [Proteiniborus sp. MB09-C3]|uniref:pilus assembly FimT family protein n=1 Tax=Proteiniborus sp. MB09-C3 TaxID=3050072 RepID=UPI00255480FA|nr:type II secretion system protein [Proteiniborus sp. MB09-C3]WIV11008.1 type II secretion system protein [Proteiniborus sp. MB09-C3]
MKRKNYSGGMTLIELLLVISILALSLSIVIPKIEKRDYHLMTSSRMLRDDIRNIRYMKMAEGKNLKISLESNQYKVIENLKVIKRVQLEKDFKITYTETFRGGDISFSYNGAPTYGGGTITIFDNKKNKYCEITIVPATGRILLKDEIYKGYSGDK